MNKFKKVMLGALSVLTLGLFAVVGTKVNATTTTYTADFKSGSLVNSTAGYFTAAKGSSSFSPSSNCTASFTSIIDGDPYSNKKGCKMESSTTITFTTTATSVSTVTILWGANIEAETDVNFDGSASSTKTAANKTNAVSETWTNVAAGSHTISRGASTNQAVVFEVKVVETINQAAGTFNVTYNNNGHGDSQDAVIGVTALPNTLPNLSATGYVFGGWYTDKDCTAGNEATAGATIAADTILYAKWTKNNDEWCTITFDANGGTCSTESAEAVFGSSYTLPTATKANYALTGWSDGTKTYKETYTVPSNSAVTLTAQWVSTEITVDNSNILTNGMIDELYTSSIITDTKITEQFDINNSIYSVLINDSIAVDARTISSELGKSTYAIKSGGNFNNAKNGLGINAPSAGKLTVYARVNGSNTYKGQLFNSSYTMIDETENSTDKNAVVAFEFDIDNAGMYYFGNSAGGFYIYYAKFVPEVTVSAFQQEAENQVINEKAATYIRFIAIISNADEVQPSDFTFKIYRTNGTVTQYITRTVSIYSALNLKGETYTKTLPGESTPHAFDGNSGTEKYAVYVVGFTNETYEGYTVSAVFNYKGTDYSTTGYEFK